LMLSSEIFAWFRQVSRNMMEINSIKK
jgi:hypothetical protein